MIWVVVIVLFLCPIIRDFVVDNMLKKNEEVRIAMMYYAAFWAVAVTLSILQLTIGVL